MFNQISGHLVAKSGWHTKLTMILINAFLSALVFAIHISEEYTHKNHIYKAEQNKANEGCSGFEFYFL